MSVVLGRIGDICEQIRGVTYSKDEAASAPAPGFKPVLRANNITEHGLSFGDLVYVPAERISVRQRVKANDVVIAASSGSIDVVGKAARALVDFDGGFGAFCKVLRPGSEVDPAYFAHFFKTPAYRRRVSGLAAGANINNLRNEHIDDLEIVLPPLAEQRRIAAILDKADALRAKRREAIAKLDQLLQSVFLDLFGDGEARKRWPHEQLGRLATTSSGGTPDRSVAEYFGGDIPWIKSGEVARGEVTHAEESITTLGMQHSSAKLVPAETVLLAMYGATAGAVAMLKIDAATNQAICAIKPSDRLNHVFLLHFLKATAPSLVAKAVGGAQPNLSQALIRSLPVPVPPRELQDQFAVFASRLTNARKKHDAATEKGDLLFASLQERAFAAGF